jgi:hypothetical protein
MFFTTVLGDIKNDNLTSELKSDLRNLARFFIQYPEFSES